MPVMTYEETFVSYGIHPKFWSGMQALIMADAKPDAELQIRLNYAENFRDCLRDLKSAGGRKQPNLSPAIEPFESIEVPNE